MENGIHTGDALEVLDELHDASVHAVVTDPPYGLAFMGRSWDDFEPKEYQAWCEEWATKTLRVLKPGGHMLAFSGNRTHHRLFSGVEDAGFEIRDTITWHYGNGFPKALDVSKALDEQAGAERDVVAEKTTPNGRPISECRGEGTDKHHAGYARPWRDDEPAVKQNQSVTAPATDEAKEWDGWRTTLKPSTEFLVLARKPLSGTVVETVLQHGTGALNIDNCRVATEDDTERADGGNADRTALNAAEDGSLAQEGRTNGGHEEGRYPPNAVFGEATAAELDADVGELKSGATSRNRDGIGSDRVFASASGQQDLKIRREKNAGGPSRFFYTSKATRSERTLDGRIENDHPTVKPLDLMEWLVKLVTAEGQIVLDPFVGSGTTCLAAKGLGRQFIGIEQQDKWADVARVRCGLTPDDPSIVRDDDSQRGLEEVGPS